MRQRFVVEVVPDEPAASASTQLPTDPVISPPATTTSLPVMTFDAAPLVAQPVSDASDTSGVAAAPAAVKPGGGDQLADSTPATVRNDQPGNAPSRHAQLGNAQPGDVQPRDYLPHSPSPRISSPHDVPPHSPPPHSPPRHDPSHQAPVPDIWQARQASVNSLLQETQLDETRQESAAIVPPHVPRRLRQEHLAAPRQREQAFKQELHHTQTSQRLEKIESFYERLVGRPAQTAQPHFASSWEKMGRCSGQWWTKVWRWWWRPPTWSARLLAGSVTLLVIGLMTIAVLWTVWQTEIRQTQTEIGALVADVQATRLPSARERLANLQKRQRRYQTLYATTRPVVRVVVGASRTNHLDQLLNLSQTGLRIAENAFHTSDLLDTGYQQFMGEQEGQTTETLQRASGNLEALYTELSTFQAQVQQLDNPFNITLINDMKSTLATNLPLARRTVLAAQQMSFVLPDLLGENGKRQYLILLQNNEELRPTGGFIGSFAILTVQDGQFVDFRVEDVYEADGQLNGYVTPPVEIVEHLGEAQWYLRDVNWSPDFPTVAQQAGWFLNKEIQVDPDGVLAINLHVAKKLLAVTGPVQLVDYDEVITKDNLYERAEMHSEINFFPGSTQKRDFLSAVANALFQKLTSDESNKMLILRAFYESAEESQLLVAVENEAAQAIVANLGWDGRVRTPECPPVFATQRCVVDTVMQVEANVGVNKANQYITRQITHEVELSKTTARHARTMKFVNAATSQAWPQGAYKNYLRLIIPANAIVTSVQVGEAELAPSARREGVEGNKKSVGFLVPVPIQSTVTVQVNYEVPLLTDGQTDPAAVYALFEQKQSGTSDDAVAHVITVNDRAVSAVAPEPVINGRQMRFTSNRRTHDFMAVEMQ